MNFRRIVAIPIVAAAAIGLTACTVTNPAPDEVGLVYNQGPVSKTEFQECVLPGGRTVSDAFDTAVKYPAGQRTYRIGSDEGADLETITVADKDATPLGMTGQMIFALDTSCDTDLGRDNPIVQFHEKIGLKYDGNWSNILRDYLVPSLRKAITEAVQQSDWRSLFADPTAKVELEKHVRDSLPGFLEQAMGGRYISPESINISLNQPVLPQAITEQNVNTQRAEAAAKQQEAENRALDLKSQGERKMVDLYGADNYVLLRAIESGSVQLMYVPQGTNINLPGK